MDSVNVEGGVGVVAQGAAEFGDAGIYGPGGDGLLPTPDGVQQALAVDEFVGVGHEVFQQDEGFRGERDFPSFERGAAGTAVDLQIPADEYPRGGQGRCSGIGAAQYSPDAGDEFVRLKGLVDIVVCPFFEGHGAFGGFPYLGEEDDREPRPFPAQAAEGFPAIETGHHHIEDDQVRAGFREHVQRVLSILSEGDFKPGAREEGKQAVTYASVVIYYQNFFLLFHLRVRCKENKVFRAMILLFVATYQS